MKNMFLALSVLMTFAASAQADNKVIVVSSFAEKAVEPDIVSVNVEIWSKANSAKQAQGLNAAEFQKVKKSLEAFKIKKEDSQTENYSLNPEYIYDQKTQQNKMVGFRALQTLKVTLKKPEDLGGFLDAMVTSAPKNDSGVNVNTIQWDTDKRSQIELSALGDAVKNGRAKADELAKAAGVKIKGVSMLSHGVSFSEPPTPRRGMMKTMALEMASDSTQVLAGQIKVRVDVSAEYEIQ